MDMLFTSFTSAWMCSSLTMDVLLNAVWTCSSVWLCSSLRSLQYGRALHFGMDVLLNSVWTCSSLQHGCAFHFVHFSMDVPFTPAWACSSLRLFASGWYGRALRFSVVCPGFSALLTPVQSVFSGTVLCVDVFFVWPWSTAAICMCFR